MLRPARIKWCALDTIFARQLYGIRTLGLILAAASLPMLGGLAALIVPHRALVERVRLSGWVKGAASQH